MSMADTAQDLLTRKTAPTPRTRSSVLDQCVVCGTPVSAPSFFQHAGVALFRCAGCGSLTALPRPSVATQIALHDNADYFEHPYFAHRRRRVQAIDRRCREIFQRISVGIDVRSLPGQRHLDVGCDTGSFALAASRLYGTVPLGLDIAQRSVEQASRQGVEAYRSTLEEAPAVFSDLAVVTAIDLVEHVVDPKTFVAEVKRRLRRGGVAYFETPNITSHVYRLGRMLSVVSGGRPTSVFERLFPPEHIQYFSRIGFEKVVAASGLEIISLATRPLRFGDIGTSLWVRLAMSGIQVLDVLAGNAILLCLVARRLLTD
jgi:SAM-dependent methyltransferase